MNKVTFSIPDISCGHCTSSIEKGLLSLSGIHSIISSIEDKTTIIEFDDSVSISQLIEELDNIGFEAKEI